MGLVFRRLGGNGKLATEFSQALFDLFFKDMDRNLREMGAGDLSVPKKIRHQPQRGNGARGPGRN